MSQIWTKILQNRHEVETDLTEMKTALSEIETALVEMIVTGNCQSMNLDFRQWATICGRAVSISGREVSISSRLVSISGRAV